jgi:hypothetical protein
VRLIALHQFLLENPYYAIGEEEKAMRGILTFCAGVVLLASAAAVSADRRNKLPIQFT